MYIGLRKKTKKCGFAGLRVCNYACTCVRVRIYIHIYKISFYLNITFSHLKNLIFFYKLN